VQFEQDTNSRYVLYAGYQPSKSYFLVTVALNLPETILTTRYGISKL